jgi:hypothetical protein
LLQRAAGANRYGERERPGRRTSMIQLRRSELLVTGSAGVAGSPAEQLRRGGSRLHRARQREEAVHLSASVIVTVARYRGCKSIIDFGA